jgi:hypothetical protein
MWLDKLKVCKTLKFAAVIMLKKLQKELTQGKDNRIAQ